MVEIIREKLNNFFGSCIGHIIQHTLYFCKSYIIIDSKMIVDSIESMCITECNVNQCESIFNIQNAIL